jgi:hypothetical protein
MINSHKTLSFFNRGQESARCLSMLPFPVLNVTVGFSLDSNDCIVGNPDLVLTVLRSQQCLAIDLENSPLLKIHEDYILAK